MLLAAHSLAGAAVGEAIGNLFYAFLAGFVVHFLLDAIPHYDTTDNGKYTIRQILLVTIDGMIALTLLAVLYFHYPVHRAGFVAGAIGGVLPDVLSIIPPVKKFMMRFAFGRHLQQFHERIQFLDLEILPGLAVQIVVWLLCIYLILNIAL